MPAHALDALAHNGKADAGARVLRPVEPFEDPEYAVLMLRCYADAIVLNPEANIEILLFPAKTDAGLNARRNKFQGVAEKIGQDLPERSFVREDPRQGRDRFDV